MVLDFNEQFKKALHLMEDTTANVFVTGRAGTGKSTLLTYFREHTKKKVAILAPTGVAAVNVRGQTIHSFFKFKPNITLKLVRKKFNEDNEKNIYAKLDAIVIDEISMVRADLLDCVDKFLRLNGQHGDLPFGGIQMIFIGDLYQLAPVVTSNEREIFRTHYRTPYFFGARAFETLAMEMVELETVYRQKDDAFIGLLNAVRNNSITESGLSLLNERANPSFEPPSHEFYIYLTSTNDQADTINHQKLMALGGRTYVFEGVRDGEFGKEYLPTAVNLEMKEGAQIMMLNNDARGRWINGTIGKVGTIKKRDNQEEIVVKLENGKQVEVSPYQWDIYNFSLRGGKLESHTVGSFTQYPLRLAFAITIHKSQGKTFHKAVIDIGRGTFAHGQMYVALSRCSTLEGMVLKVPIKKHHIRMDYEVMKFITKYQYTVSEKTLNRDDKIKMIETAIASHSSLRITYLKAKDEKSRRVIQPLVLGEMEYKDHPFLGLEAYCMTKKENRTFNVDRILEMAAEE